MIAVFLFSLSLPNPTITSTEAQREREMCVRAETGDGEDFKLETNNGCGG